MCAIALAALCACGDESAPSSRVNAERTAQAPPPVGVDSVEDLRYDDRLKHLVGGCAFTEPFLADTSDMTAILVEKLSTGQLDPLRQAKTELSALGASALPDLRRAFEANFGASLAPGRIQNMLAVVGLMESDAGRDVLLRGLEHSSETVRMSAARALKRHAHPEDFERLQTLFQVSSIDLRNDLARAMLAADAPRLAREFAGWLTSSSQTSTLSVIAPLLGPTRDPEAVALLGAARDRCPPDVRRFVIGVLAANGDAPALAELRAELRHADASHRMLAARALEAAGLAHEFLDVLQADPDESIRTLVYGRWAAEPFDTRVRDRLTGGLGDGVIAIREACLRALLLGGDAAARAEALQLLAGTREDVEHALRALQPSLAQDAQLAREALDVLLALTRGERVPVLVDERTLERAIAQMPLADAARFLVERGRAQFGLREGLRAHRWYCLQAGNTGAPGRAWLRAEWARESDPARRMDLVMAAAFERTDELRAFLESVIESENATAAEILQACDLCVKRGPAARVAPLVKRAALRVSDPVIRPALNCLLWTWYGPSRG